MRPLTETIPKSLLPVAGKPFLAHQLELLRNQGITRVVLCVGHLGDRIQQQFGDGSLQGMKLDYSFDGPVLLGTGGALQKALPVLGEKFFVLYGDSYLPIDFRPIAEAFERSGKLGLMTVYENQNRFDTSNVWFSLGEIKAYDKKHAMPQMQHIDYGLSVFSASAFERHGPGGRFDLAELLQRLLAEHQLAGFEVRERFYEIGSPSGLTELEQLLASQKRE